MAENLAKASVPEDEILSVMSSKQLQKSNLGLKEVQPFENLFLFAMGP